MDAVRGISPRLHRDALAMDFRPAQDGHMDTRWHTFLPDEEMVFRKYSSPFQSIAITMKTYVVCFFYRCCSAAVPGAGKRATFIGRRR